MKLGEAATAGAAFVLRNVDIALLGKVLDQQRQEGRAAVQLIAGAGEVAGPPRASEPGKGQLVDVVV